MEKEQVAIVSAMIEMTYRPVIRRAIVNLVLLDINRILESVKLTNKFARDKEMMEVLSSDDCKVALIKAIRINHAGRAADVSDEIINQYNLILIKEEVDLYHRLMESAYLQEIEDVVNKIGAGDYNWLYSMSREAYQQ